MQTKAILFDVGGTLYKCDEFDSQVENSVEELLATRIGIDIPSARERLQTRIRELSASEGDPSKVRAMATFGVSRQEVHEAFCRVDPSKYLKSSEETTGMMVGLKEKGLRLAVLSNFKLVLVERIFAAISMPMNIFDFVLSEDDNLPIKPSLIPFRECIARFRRAPSEVAYVGDSLKKDMSPARKVGMTTYWVNDEPVDPKPGDVDYIVTRVNDLGDYFETAH